MKSNYLRLNKWIIGLAILVSIIFVAAGCAPANHQPTITSIKAVPEAVYPSGSCQIECAASDDDDDELSYEWSASKGHIDGDGSIVTWNAPESAGIYSVTVKVIDGNEGEVSNSIAISVRGNHPPTIVSLTADTDWIEPSNSCQLKCEVKDLDGDKLSYEWSANGGVISGEGSVVTWTAPETTGLCNIAIAVADGHGEEDKALLAITVALSPPPIIEDLVVTSEHPKYVKRGEENTDRYKILKSKSCEIKCVVVNASSELIYEWSCGGGKISGEGSVVTWIAPPDRGTVTITVTVSDAEGEVASKNIVFEVNTCACSLKNWGQAVDIISS
ncbi:MAG: hypothetical protein J7K94_05190 [Dehalococcoidia bacterium]|nr:hypothetical protein [Dehalococcoidia bacterium]